MVKMIQKSKQNKRLLFVFVIILLLAAGAVAAIKMLLPADARALYFKAESRNFEKYSKWINDNYASYIEKQRPYIENNYRRRIEITADADFGGEASGQKVSKGLSDLIKGSKLVVDIKRQPADNSATSVVSLLLWKVPFIDAELFQTGGRLYFTVPVLLPDKYFSVDINKLDEVYDKFSIPIRPKSLVNSVEIAEAIDFNKEEMDASAEKLGSIFSGLISEDDVKFGNKKELVILGRTLKGKEVIISPDALPAGDILKGIAEYLSSDKTLAAYTYGNFAGLSELFDDAGLFSLIEYLDESGVARLNEDERRLVRSLNIKKDIDGFTGLLKNALNNCKLSNNPKMTVFIDKSGNILVRKLTLEMISTENEKSFIFELDTGISSIGYDDLRNKFVRMKVSIPNATAAGKSDSDFKNGAEGMTYELLLSPLFEKSEGQDEKGTVDISFSAGLEGGERTGADLSLGISNAKDKNTQRDKTSVKYLAEFYGKSGEGKLEGEINSVLWGNKKLNTSNKITEISVLADIPNLGINDFSAVVKLAKEDTLGIDPPDMPDISRLSLTDLNLSDDNEMDKIEMEITASFGMFYITNKDVFDALLGH